MHWSLYLSSWALLLASLTRVSGDWVDPDTPQRHHHTHSLHDHSELVSHSLPHSITHVIIHLLMISFSYTITHYHTHSPSHSRYHTVCQTIPLTHSFTHSLSNVSRPPYRSWSSATNSRLPEDHSRTVATPSGHPLTKMTTQMMHYNTTKMRWSLRVTEC